MKTAVLFSGGVDSSVALHMLKRSGEPDLTAFYLKIWLEDEQASLGDCPWETDLAYARAVCDQLEVPLRIVPLQTEYRERVVEHTLSELRAGRTPSPDILCNQRIKFGAFLDHIGPDYDKVASGHYAQVRRDGDRFLLFRSPDPVKDQTYFLSHLSQAQLARALFPIGHLTKREVRAAAKDAGLATEQRKDSQGICFLGKINYADFVRFHLGQRTGEIVELDTGKVLGSHDGYWFYTIGQRQGLGLGNGPWFVVRKDVEANRIYVSHKETFRNEARTEFDVSGLNWIGAPPNGHALHVKVRHGPELESCELEQTGPDRYHVRLAHEETGIAAGQHAIFYHDTLCLGGGVIL